jgi:alcohol dehydrogenase
MTGYESLGRVLAHGRLVSGLQAGRRVLATYGHRSAALLPAKRIIPVPDHIDDAVALLAILACDCHRGIARVAPRPYEPVLISGAGTIGLLTLWNLRARNVEQVDVIEPEMTRRTLALRLGARNVFVPGAIEFGSNYAAGFECSSRNAAFGELQQRMRPGGRICILADGNLEPLELDPVFHVRELSVAGSSDGEDYPGYAAWFYETLRSNGAPLADLFEWRITADQLADCFATLDSTAARPVKVLVRWQVARPPEAAYNRSGNR